MATRRRVKPVINSYAVIERAVEEGVAYAVQRIEREKESLSVENITRHVMDELSQVINYEATNK
jgi:hypothetical protein